MSHILPKTLVALPYVDRKPVPDERPDQKRVEWIRVGECLGAAETIIDNSGEMNRSGVQIQKNAVTLYENDLILNGSLTEVIARVNNHDDVLGQIGDDNLATKLEELEEKVDPMSDAIVQHTQNIFLIGEAQQLLTAKLGKRADDDTTLRTAFADLGFIKRDILGNWTNKDFNEISVPNKIATGLKYRIETQGLAIAGNTRRIDTLEENWVNSDVGQLKADIDQIRVEVGPSRLAPAQNIYKWIESANATHTALQANIDQLENEINDAGAGKTIAERVTDIETLSSDNETKIGVNTDKIHTMNLAIGDSTIPSSLQYRMISTETVVSKHNAELYGVSGNAGVVASLQAISTDIGSDAVTNSIKGRLVTCESNTLKVQQDISTIKTQIGVNISGHETGIYRRIFDLEEAIDNSTTGLVVKVTKNAADIATKLDDAPNDDKQYARKAGVWTQVESAVVGEAPIDTNDYVRANGAWAISGRNGLVVPVTKKLSGHLPNATKVDFIDTSATAIKIGDATVGLEFVGAIHELVIEDASVIKNKSNKKIIELAGNKIEIGNTTSELVLTSDNVSPVSVKVGSATHRVFHAGNLNVNRVNGGWKFSGDKSTALPAGTNKEIALPALSTYGFNYGCDILGDGLQYTHDEAKACQVNFRFDVTTTASKKVTFALFLNGQATGETCVVESSEWPTTTKMVRVEIIAPFLLNKNDVFTMQAIAEEEDSIRVTRGHAYLIQMS